MKDIKKPFCNVCLFGKNEACAKCGTNKQHKVNLVTDMQAKATLMVDGSN